MSFEPCAERMLLRVAADFTVVDTAPSSQAVYIPAGHLVASDPFVIEAERVVRHAMDQSLTAHHLARQLSTSERTPASTIYDERLGESPKQFIDRIRLKWQNISRNEQQVRQTGRSRGRLR